MIFDFENHRGWVVVVDLVYHALYIRPAQHGDVWVSIGSGITNAKANVENVK